MKGQDDDGGQVMINSRVDVRVEIHMDGIKEN